jgi:glyoxylase-like metal-dependent hydrolase (beta-lactamase superfamily II)/rhodanese-related sulfurtransferase
MTLTSTPHVVVIDSIGLGDRSYVVHDGISALVVDPQRDIDRVERVLAEHNVKLTHVAETHIHNDYVTGGLELARKHGATYVVPGNVELAYLSEPFVLAVSDGDAFNVGDFEVTAIHTPGHTPHHISYSAQKAGNPGAVFTGGSMLFGSVGRPDLVAPDLTLKQTHDQWNSVQRLAQDLDGATGVFPTHGFGSFCSATQAAGGYESTIGKEKLGNPALTQSEEEFVKVLLDGLDVFPAYYAHMGPANAAGAPDVNLELPKPADPEALRAAIAAGEWVVDLRSREVFSQGHIPGAVNFDLDGAFINYLAWLMPWGTPVTLVGATTEQVEAAMRELVRVGINSPKMQAVGDHNFWMPEGESPATTRRVDFQALKTEWEGNPQAMVIDTRQIKEWEAGHVDGAVFIPFYEILDRLADIPRTKDVYVYCGSGYRAAAVASILANLGYDRVIHVDDNFSNAATAGLNVIPDSAPHREPGWTWLASRASVREFNSATAGVLAG